MNLKLIITVFSLIFAIQVFSTKTLSQIPANPHHDTYSWTNLKAGKSHLDDIAIILKENSGETCYIVIYGNRKKTNQTKGLFRKYLIEQKKINNERIKFVDG